MTGLGAQWRVARRLALSSDPRQRWRQLSVTMGALIATVAVLLGLGMVNAATTVDQHLRGRSPVISTGQGTSLFVDVTGPVVPGGFSQIPVVWLEPVPGHEGDPSVVPPGLSALPDPGSAVLSPGLVAAGYTAGDFGFASSDVGIGDGGVIGDVGLASRSEGFVYTRAAEGRSLDQDGGALASMGYGALERGEPRYPLIETVLDVPTTLPALAGVTWLLWIPGLLLLCGAARAVSVVRQERAASLWALGIPARSIRGLAGFETAVLAAIGSLLGATLWVVALDHRTTFPVTDGELLPGAMLLPWWGVVAGAAAVPVLAALTAAAGSIQPGRKVRSVRRAATWLLVPLLASLGIMFAAPNMTRILPGGDSDIILIVLFIGALATMASIPVAMPALTGMLGQLLGRMATRPTWWLAGRKLSLSKHHLSRPGALVGALVFVAGAAFALLQGSQQADRDLWLKGGDRAVWSVDWADAGRDDSSIVAARARDAGVAITPVVLTEPSGGAEMPAPSDGSVAFLTCAAAAQFFGLPQQDLSCATSADPGELPSLPYTIELGSPASSPDQVVDRLLVSAPRDWDDVMVMSLFSTLPTVNPSLVIGPSDAFIHPGNDWLSAGWTAASILLLAGLLRELGDRTVRAVPERSSLLTTGLLDREADGTYTVATLLPVLTAVPIGFAAATLFALRGWGAGVTVFNLGLIALVSLAATILSLAMVLTALRWQRRAIR